MIAETGASVKSTVLDHLLHSLRGRDVAPDGQERPAAILWTDPGEEWRAAVEVMQARAPELLVLGEYRPEARTGPAVWLRCIVDGALDEPKIPEEHRPILYLPGVARQGLRAGEECPDALKPLVELMFRGTLWLQPNGHDWTVSAFLSSPKGLGLDLAKDQATVDALLRALREVLITPVTQLAGRRLQADDFDRLLTGDVIRDLLRWMGDPEGTRARLGANGWAAFCSRCREERSFDPESEADVTAGERLAAGEGPWKAVWERFVEAPAGYGDIAGLLRRSKPVVGALPFQRERWPDLNEEDENVVRKVLGGLPKLGHVKACETVLRLEEEHARRRDWVWARMGLAPLAQVLQPLARLAAACGTSLGGMTPDEVASAYAERGWQADASAWEAVALAPRGDEDFVATAVRHLLEPWLEDGARAFQAAVERTSLPGRGGQPPVEAAEDQCIVFADGLRYDLGQRLAERLEGRGCRVTVQRRWAALPTVTATAKPAVTPLEDEILGESLGADFAPRFQATGKNVDAPGLRARMAKRGYQVLGGNLLDAPCFTPARGWVEAGEIDRLGHEFPDRLPRQIGEELEQLTGRVLSLLDSGWHSVRVVTDHGWLFLPGGLPKVELPRHLTESRWARCAVVAGSATPSVPRAPWHWNSAQWFATAPGIACFNRGEQYAHGGLSIQECLTPDLLVERTGEVAVTGAITSITWRRLRCLVEVSSRGGRVTADLRLSKPSGPTVVAAPKPVEADGSASLVLASDEHEGAELVLVLLDDDGRILAHQRTRVGVDS